jgi:hypothetical protein
MINQLEPQMARTRSRLIETNDQSRNLSWNQRHPFSRLPRTVPKDGEAGIAKDGSMQSLERVSVEKIQKWANEATMSREINNLT